MGGGGGWRRERERLSGWRRECRERERQKGGGGGGRERERLSRWVVGGGSVEKGGGVRERD